MNEESKLSIEIWLAKELGRHPSMIEVDQTKLSLGGLALLLLKMKREINGSS